MCALMYGVQYVQFDSILQIDQCNVMQDFVRSTSYLKHYGAYKDDSAAYCETDRQAQRSINVLFQNLAESAWFL